MLSASMPAEVSWAGAPVWVPGVRWSRGLVDLNASQRAARGWMDTPTGFRAPGSGVWATPATAAGT
jgi:hypothetical protein